MSEWSHGSVISPTPGRASPTRCDARSGPGATISVIWVDRPVLEGRWLGLASTLHRERAGRRPPRNAEAKGDHDVVGPLATILSVLPIAYLNLPPAQSLVLGGSRDLLALIAVLGVGLLLSILNAQRLRAERRAEIVADELELVIDEQRTLEAITVKLATVADELQTSVERYRQQVGSLARTGGAGRPAGSRGRGAGLSVIGVDRSPPGREGKAATTRAS